MKFITRTSLALFTALVVLVACKKDKEDSISTSKTVFLTVIPTLGTETLALDTPYEINGQLVEFSFFKFYLSNVEVRDDEGNVIVHNNGFPILVSTEGIPKNIGSAEIEVLHNLYFDVGLDSLTNHQDPITATTPMNDVEMHWNWNPGAGYKFFRMDGTVDTQFFESHAATDLLFQEGIGLSVHDVSTSGTEIEIVMYMDLSNALDGILIPAGGEHGDTNFNISYMNKLGTAEPFTIE
jgi:hypothetical protein